jgi:phasin family protein
MTAFPNDMNELTNSFSKACEDANAFITSYMGAATKSSAAAWQGFEAMARNMNEMIQDQVTRSVSISKTLMTAKSPQEAADTHAEYMKDCFDNLVAGGSKISEISLHTAKGAIDPLSQHANEAMGAIMKKAKAA